MTIGFINLTSFLYDVETPYKKPLGGSESGMCYLSENLALLGHRIILFTHLKKRTFKRGVDCIPALDVPDDILANLDFLIVQNSPAAGIKTRQNLTKKTKLILWIGLDTDPDIVAPLSEEKVQKEYDQFVFVSNWQKKVFISTFKLNPKKCHVFYNAVAPAFENLFNKKDLISEKTKPPIIAYTSTPFRGLDLLIKMFPFIRAAIPGVTLRIYSGMKVYQMKNKEEGKLFGELYSLCRSTRGVEYIGAVPQPQLAKEMKGVSVLAYPNTFRETSCQAVMEAMAAGCKIITSNLGALPETAAGFAELVDVDGNWMRYCQTFMKKTIDYLNKIKNGGAQSNEDLYKQVKYVNNNYKWSIRAKEWEKWLKLI